MNEDSCSYKLLQFLEAIAMLIMALVYIFTGPGGDGEPWKN